MKILIAGDYYVNPNTKVVIDDFDIKSFQCDYHIVNYESPVSENEGNPIAKYGPNLRSRKSSLSDVKQLGFDCITLANNHVLDFGVIALQNTIEAAKEIGLDTVGAGNNQKDASNIHYKSFGNRTIAIINCCEHEFSVATDDCPGTCGLDAVTQYRQIQESRSHADFVLVIVHGGSEHCQIPSERMVKLYRWFVDVGADAIVNHHQHCYSGFEIYNKKPIFYGLGNFIFPKLTNKVNKTWHEGYLVSLDFEKEGISFEMYPYIQNLDKSLRLMNSKERILFDKRINELNIIISSSEKLRAEWENISIKNRKMYRSIFSPFCSRILNGLWCRSFFSKNLYKIKRYQMIDYLDCESHRERLLALLKRDKLFER